MITTRISTPDDTNHTFVKSLTELINQVYVDAEQGLWRRPTQRMNEEELKGLLSSQQIILAEQDDVVMGSVRVRYMGSGIGEFGTLVAHPRYRGQGVGGALVKAAEKWAQTRGCQTMRLELLTPVSWEHPVKAFLEAWYIRLGYALSHTEPLGLMYPHLVDELATECDFTVWLKSLDSVDSAHRVP